MTFFSNPLFLVLGFILVLASLGMILARKPVHSCLYFLLVLLTLSVFYLELSAEFIGIMQTLVYAGAILVIFMFVIILFQDAHQQLAYFLSKSFKPLLIFAGASFTVALVFIGNKMREWAPAPKGVSLEFGSAQALGEALYLDFFFPFEAVTLLFLVAVVGALYIGRKAD